MQEVGFLQNRPVMPPWATWDAVQAVGSPGEIRTPVDGSLPDFWSPKPIIGRVIVFRPLLVHYTTGLQETRVPGQDPISLLRHFNR